MDVLAQMLDVSEDMATIDALHAREQLLGQLTETVPVGLFHADLAGNLLFANGRLSELMGSALGPKLIDQLGGVDPEDRSELDAALHAAVDGTGSTPSSASRRGSDPPLLRQRPAPS